MCDLSVIIVNYNAQHFLQLCLDALEDALQGINAEVIVVDNVSSDKSCAIVEQQYTWVKLIKNTENVGFGKANNQGAALAHGQHLLILNPDTIVSATTIRKSLDLLNTDSTIGAIGVKMLDGSGRFLPESKRGLPTPQVAFYKAFGLARLFPRSKTFARYYLGHLPQHQNSDVEVLAGAYMMIPAHVYQQCKGFDEDFFMYGEDIDLSYRISKLGYRLFYLADSPIIHFKGESTVRNAARDKRFYGAMALFSEKHFANKGRIFNTFIHWGIGIHQALSQQQKRLTPPIKTSNLRAKIILEEGTTSYAFPLANRFLATHFIPINTLKNKPCSTIIFTPEISADEQLKIMQHSTKDTLFFFCPKNKNYLLLSPKSNDSGQIIC